MLTLKLEDNGSDTLIIFWASGELQKVLGINAWHYDALLWSYAAIFFMIIHLCGFIHGGVRVGGKLVSVGKITYCPTDILVAVYCVQIVKLLHYLFKYKPHASHVVLSEVKNMVTTKDMCDVGAVVGKYNPIFYMGVPVRCRGDRRSGI